MYFILTKENAADHDMKTQNVGKRTAVKKRKISSIQDIPEEIRCVSANFQLIRQSSENFGRSSLLIFGKSSVDRSLLAEALFLVFAPVSEHLEKSLC